MDFYRNSPSLLRTILVASIIHTETWLWFLSAQKQKVLQPFSGQPSLDISQHTQPQSERWQDVQESARTLEPHLSPPCSCTTALRAAPGFLALHGQPCQARPGSQAGHRNKCKMESMSGAVIHGGHLRPAGTGCVSSSSACARANLTASRSGVKGKVLAHWEGTKAKALT